jgi:hypothetical protein
MIRRMWKVKGGVWSKKRFLERLITTLRSTSTTGN